jgi:hypothetical protein
MRLLTTPAEARTNCDLTYNISSGVLSGMVDGVSILCHAGSGGRAGTKTPGALNIWLANNPFATGVVLGKNNEHPGGPLPMGKYRLSLHESRENWLRLLPVDPSLMRGRTLMAIHGPGERGSDGCVVPTDFANVLLLVKLARQRRNGGRPDITLKVVAIGQDLDAMLHTA